MVRKQRISEAVSPAEWCVVNEGGCLGVMGAGGMRSGEEDEVVVRVGQWERLGGMWCSHRAFKLL
jgi:hypothetical protein